MSRNIVVNVAPGAGVDDLPVEIVERKGIGHPDSLCDGMAERISLAYMAWCQAHLGAALHHNFDKVQLVAGGVDVGFGRGQMLKPIRVQIAGRGTTITPDGRRVPLEMIAIQAAKEHIRQTMRHLSPDRDCVIDCYAGSGASELIHLVGSVAANDTSFGVAHWPLSLLEQLVYDVAQYLNYELINAYPIGEDVKVMGVRQGNRLQLTCAVPFLALQIPDLAYYRQVKAAVTAAVESYAMTQTGRLVQVAVNTADDEASGAVYLTLTGSSAECGDDGAVGRGNRITGLITPFRATSLEAAAGKNPISHVGKLYNALAWRAAQAVVNQIPAVRQAQIVLLSQIGGPLDQPQVACVTVWPTAAGDLSSAETAAIAAVLDAQLARVDDLRQAILAREIPMF